MMYTVERVTLTRRRGDAEKTRRKAKHIKTWERSGSGGAWAGAIGLVRNLAAISACGNIFPRTPRRTGKISLRL